MTLRLVEGFDHMSSYAKFGLKGWTQQSTYSGSDMAFNIASGRIAGNAIKLTQNNGTSAELDLKKSLPSNYSTVICGFAFQMDKRPKTGQNGRFFRFYASGTSCAELFIKDTGQIQVRNNGGTVIATSTTALNANTWYYIELKIVINGASGSCTLQLNGAAEIAATTGNFGSTNIDAIDFWLDGTPWQNANNLLFDDVYVCDTAGSVNNSFLGDVCVETLYPNADGAHSDWTPNSGSVHYDRVKEASGTYPDDDTTYNSDSTVGNRDSYAYGDLVSLSGSIFGVQTNLWARKDDAGTRQICAVVRVSSTDYDGATATLSTSYSDYTEIRETNPNTSAAWTVSDVNGAEFGVKTVA